MRNSMIFFSALILGLGSCNTSRKATSEWAQLDAAQAISCANWPMPEKALDVKRIYPILGKNSAFITQYGMRNGQRAYFYQAFADNEELDRRKAEERSFGNDALPAGGAIIQGKIHLAVVQNRGNSRQLELRSAADNVVRYSAATHIKDFQEPEIFVNGNDVWLRYSEAHPDLAIEDATVGFAHFKFAAGFQKLGFENTITGLPTNTQIIFSQDKETKALFVYGQKTSNDDRSFKFYLRTLTNNQTKLSSAIELEFPIESGVESWAVTSTPSGFYLSAVDGDSLIGQANLRIAKIDWQDGYHKASWAKTRSLSNEHISDGLWINLHSRAHLVLPKWVDSESTLGVYTVDGEGIENSRIMGIFPSSVRLLSTLTDSKLRDSYLLTRHQERNAQVYQLCRLGRL